MWRYQRLHPIAHMRVRPHRTWGCGSLPKSTGRVADALAWKESEWCRVVACVWCPTCSRSEPESARRSRPTDALNRRRASTGVTTTTPGLVRVAKLRPPCGWTEHLVFGSTSLFHGPRADQGRGIVRGEPGQRREGDSAWFWGSRLGPGQDGHLSSSFILGDFGCKVRKSRQRSRGRKESL